MGQQAARVPGMRVLKARYGETKHPEERDPESLQVGGNLSFGHDSETERDLNTKLLLMQI